MGLFSCFSKPKTHHTATGSSEAEARVRVDSNILKDTAWPAANEHPNAAAVHSISTAAANSSRPASCGNSHAGSRAGSVYYDCDAHSDIDPAEWPAVEHEAFESGSHVGASGEHVLLLAPPTGHGWTHGNAGSNSGVQQQQQQHGNALEGQERLANIMQGLQQGNPMCLTCSKLWSYKKAHSLTLEQLEQQIRSLPATPPDNQHQQQHQQHHSHLQHEQQQQHHHHHHQQHPKQHKQPSQPPAASGATAAAALDGCPRSIDDVMLNLKALEGALVAVHSQDGWRQVSNGPLQLYFRHEGGYAGVKGCAVLDEPLESCLATCREADLLHLWNSMYSDSDILHKFSLSEFIVFQCVWLPWPLTPPGCLIHCHGFDVLEEEGAVVVSCSSIEEQELPPGGRRPQPKGKRDIVTMRHNCFHFAPLPPDPITGRPRTAVCALANMHNVNLNMASALLRVFAPVVYVVVKRTLRKLFNPDNRDSGARAMQQRMASEPGVYAHLTKHMAAYLQSDAVKRHQAKFRASGMHPDA